MNLQVALDRLTQEECMETLAAVQEHVDIIEVGTGVINQYGLTIVKDIKTEYPSKQILADLKICDAGDSESRNAFRYGADIITVMSFADSNTIEACIQNANKYNGEVVVDMLNNQSVQTLHELSSIHVQNISLHVGKDQQKSETVISPLSETINSFNFNIYVAGGINANNIEDFLKLHPAVVIVGSGITKSVDKNAAGKNLKRIIHTFEAEES